MRRNANVDGQLLSRLRPRSQLQTRFHYISVEFLVSMASGQKKCSIRWDSDNEKKLIEVWADILEQTNGKMITRKKKEALATQRVNRYITEELGKKTTFSDKEIRNKIDWMLKKGKQFYTVYQKKGETGKGINVEQEVELDLEAAEVA